MQEPALTIIMGGAEGKPTGTMLDFGSKIAINSLKYAVICSPGLSALRFVSDIFCFFFFFSSGAFPLET